MISLKKIIALSLPLGLATLAVFNGQGQSARALESLGESPAQLRLSALETVMKGDKHAALDIYESAIRRASSDYGQESTFLGDLYYETGRLYLELDQFDHAEDYLRQAVKINPKNASARLALARLLDLREKVQESIGQIREALLINPNSPVARQKFVQTLSKYGQSPSDKAIATQESLTLATMQKNARDSLKKTLTVPGEKSESAADKKTNSDLKKVGSVDGKRPLSVPVLPKNLVPLKEEQGKAGEKDEATAALTSAGQTKADTKSSTKEKTKDKETEKEKEKSREKESAKNSEASGEKSSESKNTESAAPSSGSKLPSLFPLKDLSERKLKEELNKRIEARARKKMEEAIKKGSSGDVIDQLKAQANQHEKAKAAEERAAKEKEKEREREKERAKARAAKAAKPENKAKPKAEAGEKAVQKSKAAEKPKQEEAAPAKAQQSAPPVMAAPQYFQPPVYQLPPAAPKPKSGKGFVPPPPPTLPIYGGGMMPGMPQVVQPPPAPKPTPKAKVEKPKAAPKEEAKPAEDKPPPMTTTGETDPDFLLDWGELPKNKGKKKAK